MFHCIKKAVAKAMAFFVLCAIFKNGYAIMNKAAMTGFQLVTASG